MKQFVAALLIMMMIVTPAFAGDMLNSWGNSDEYVKKVPGMILRGACNVIAIPFDILMGVVNGTKEGPPVGGTLVGVLTGVQDGLDRAGRASFDVVGSIFPGFNGFPDYKPCPLTGKKLGNPAAEEMK